MEVPREQAEKLREVVLNLNDKMNALLQQEKAEFLAAYRAHTKKIQEDLTRLRARVAEEEASFQKDEKVRQMQNDRDRFRNDALLLDAQTLAMKKQLMDMKTMLEVLEDDRNFLVKQLRSAKQDNDAVRAELTGEGGGWISGSSDAEGRHGEKKTDVNSTSSMSTAELLDNLKASISRTEDQLPQLVARHRSSNERLSVAHEGAHHVGTVRNHWIVDGVRRELCGVHAAIGTERKQRETLERAVAHLTQRRRTHWLETLLLECIEQVTGNIEKRRCSVEATNRKGASHRTSAKRDRGVEISDAAITTNQWNEAALHLDWFTAPDRVEVLRVLLNDMRLRKALKARATRCTEQMQRVTALQSEEPADRTNRERDSIKPAPKVSRISKRVEIERCSRKM
jgi:hypothetical protein